MLDESTVKAWARLVRAQQLLLGRVEGELKAAGLPPLSWYDVLLEVNRGAGGRLRQYQIGEQVLLSKYNVSRLLDRLQAAGLIDRQLCEEDRRGANVAITREGKALLRKMWPVYERAIERHFARHLSDPEIGRLAGLLQRLIDAP